MEEGPILWIIKVLVQKETCFTSDVSQKKKSAGADCN
jgi:hypothetical protein